MFELPNQLYTNQLYTIAKAIVCLHVKEQNKMFELKVDSGPILMVLVLEGMAIPNSKNK